MLCIIRRIVCAVCIVSFLVSCAPATRFPSLHDMHHVNSRIHRIIYTACPESLMYHVEGSHAVAEGGTCALDRACDVSLAPPVKSRSQFLSVRYCSESLLTEEISCSRVLLAERYYSERYCRERYCRKRYCRERYCREILLREIYCRETLLREQDDGIHRRGTGEEHSGLDVRPDWSPGLTHCLQHQHRLS